MADSEVIAREKEHTIKRNTVTNAKWSMNSVVKTKTNDQKIPSPTLYIRFFLLCFHGAIWRMKLSLKYNYMFYNFTIDDLIQYTKA